MDITQKNLVLYRNVWFAENVYAFFELSADGVPMYPVIGRNLEDVLLMENYHANESDPNPDGSFPVYSDDDNIYYVGRIFFPVFRESFNN